MALFNSKSDLPAPLTSIERAELAKCESVITAGIAGFAAAGKALARIRDKQLFRESHDSFEKYVADTWKMGRDQARNLINAAAVLENLTTTVAETLPATERQARPLSKLPPDQQGAAWSEVLAEAPRDASGKPLVTAAAVEAAVSKRTGKKKRRRGVPKPVRIKVPGGIVTFAANAKFSGSVEDALRAAIGRLASDHQQSKAA